MQDQSSIHFFDAVKNIIVACILSTILGMDFVITITEYKHHQYELMSTLGGVGITLWMLIVLLIVEIDRAIKLSSK